MKVEAIHVRAPDETEVREVGVVDAIAGKGLDGDRYFFADGARPGLARTAGGNMAAAFPARPVRAAPGSQRSRGPERG